MQQPEFQPLADTLEYRQKVLLLGSLMLCLFLAALDQTIVSTAIPRILADLGGFDLFAWLFTSYMLASTVVIPLVGKLSDIYGRKTFLLIGIVGFTAGSALCGLAPNIETLIVFRALQGLGGGMLFATVFATMGDLFAPAERGRYVGLFTGVFSLASVLGPTLGGFITDNFGWRWIFYVNVPVAAVALPAVIANLPDRRGLRRPKIDFLGAATLSAASVLLLLALEFGGDDYAWGSFQIIGMFLAAALLVAWFLLIERRHEEPIVPLHLFRNQAFLVANLIGFIIGVAMFGAISYLPTFVQTSLETSATASGIVTTPQSLGVLVASVIGGQLITRTGRYRWQTTAGTALILIAMLSLTQVGIDTPKWHVSASMVFLGLGMGLIMPTISLAAQNAVDYRYLGVATSSSQFFRQIGGVMGVAVFGAILSGTYSGAFDDNLSAEAKAGLPAPIIAEFDNPTIGLEEAKFAALQDQVRQLPDGEAMLESAVLAVREGVATAIRQIFWFAAAIVALCLVTTLFFKELPLRRALSTVPGGQPEAPPGAAPAPGTPTPPHPEAAGQPTAGGS